MLEIRILFEYIVTRYISKPHEIFKRQLQLLNAEHP